jgi:cytochrome c553
MMLRKTLALWLLVLASATPALAQDELEETLALCTSCHGDAGLPEESDIPIVWGQEFYYLYVQLKDYKAGRRANETMSGIVAELDKPTMQALAQHFAEQAWPYTGARASEEEEAVALGALAAGQCVQCHLGGYEGNSRVPRLAGQSADYLERTMLEFKTKVRLNSPAKGSLLGAYPDDQIRAMARYLAGL